MTGLIVAVIILVAIAYLLQISPLPAWIKQAGIVVIGVVVLIMVVKAVLPMAGI